MFTITNTFPPRLTSLEMDDAMILVLNQNKIIEVIVLLITIPMMHIFILLKWSTKIQGHE